MIDHVVVDVEIQRCVEEVPRGWDATDQLGVAVACVWEYRTRRMRVYGPEDVSALQERLLKADRVSGYNIWNFDFQVIWGFSKDLWKLVVRPDYQEQADEVEKLKSLLLPKTDDLLRRIWQALNLDPDNFDPKTHGGWKLDDVAEATLGVRKIGYGGAAPKWYQKGLVQKVVNYCADDVALERDLTDYVERYGYVLNGRGTGNILRIPPWEGKA